MRTLPSGSRTSAVQQPDVGRPRRPVTSSMLRPRLFVSPSRALHLQPRSRRARFAAVASSRAYIDPDSAQVCAAPLGLRSCAGRLRPRLGRLRTGPAFA